MVAGKIFLTDLPESLILIRVDLWNFLTLILPEQLEIKHLLLTHIAVRNRPNVKKRAEFVKKKFFLARL